MLAATQEDRNAGSCQCLADFFSQGFRLGQSDTGRDCWLINSSVRGYIDRDIPAESLEKLRNSIQAYLVHHASEAITQVKQLAQQGPLPPWGEPQFFPESQSTPTVLPGPRYGHRLEGPTIAHTWVKILHRIKTTGAIRPTQYGPWQELIDLTAIVTAEPEDFYFPEPNFLPIQPQFMGDYIAQMLADAPRQEGVKYTYGQRLRSWFGRDQIQQAIDKLTQEPDSSRVVMSLWDVQDYENSDSPPCLNHLWLRILDGELSLTATFRSNDMFSAWPANAMGLRALQRHILEQVNQPDLKMGPLITISQSAHIYSDCWDYADQIIDQEYRRLHQQRAYQDPSGSFLISLTGQQMVVEHLTPGSGEVVNCFSGASAQGLYRQLAAACPALEVEHALYLGTELQKAELALRLGQGHRYQQDQPLRLQED
jgi:thymidylate synthase